MTGLFEIISSRCRSCKKPLPIGDYCSIDCMADAPPRTEFELSEREREIERSLTPAGALLRKQAD